MVDDNQLKIKVKVKKDEMYALVDSYKNETYAAFTLLNEQWETLHDTHRWSEIHGGIIEWKRTGNYISKKIVKNQNIFWTKKKLKKKIAKYWKHSFIHLN